MSRGRWFLPETPDVLGMLGSQLSVTNEALRALAAWAGGDAGAATTVREAEPRGDAAKRALLESLRDSFVTPIEPEDLFALSRSIDWILDHSRDLIEESEAMQVPPDSGIAEMAGRLSEAGIHLERAVALLGEDGDAATAAADAAIKSERRLEHAYFQGMAGLLEVADQRVRISQRELYRRCLRIGETVIDVGERIVYAVVKQS
ncbi:MAG TPA: DUF47 family protein [Solirubrobacterales bacterium]|nr:DUF47 family protein [Solirubrobacterales bacterium]